jgi:hypothetical protein
VGGGIAEERQYGVSASVMGSSKALPESDESRRWKVRKLQESWVRLTTNGTDVASAHCHRMSTEHSSQEQSTYDFQVHVEHSPGHTRL